MFLDPGEGLSEVPASELVLMLALPLTGSDTSIPQIARPVLLPDPASSKSEVASSGPCFGYPLSWGSQRRSTGWRGARRNGVESTLRRLQCSDKLHLPSQPDPQGLCKTLPLLLNISTVTLKWDLNPRPFHP